jgi:DNA-binding response OmpR family regulator
MVSQARIFSGLQALVVDDYPGIASLVGEIMTGEGASVVLAGTGAAAMRLIATKRFDFMILDLGIPQPDGLKIIASLTATASRLLRRTLVLTGLRSDGPASAILNRLGIPCLRKPFQIVDLIDMVSRMWLSRSTAKPAA